MKNKKPAIEIISIDKPYKQRDNVVGFFPSFFFMIGMIYESSLSVAKKYNSSWQIFSIIFVVWLLVYILFFKWYYHEVKQR